MLVYIYSQVYIYIYIHICISIQTYILMHTYLFKHMSINIRDVFEYVQRFYSIVSLNRLILIAGLTNRLILRSDLPY